MADELQEVIKEIAGALNIAAPAQVYEPQSAAKREQEEEAENISVQYDLDNADKITIAKRIIQFVDDCEASRTEWEATRIETLDLLDGVRPPKSTPWPGCSNISVMAVATHVNIMHAKLMPAVWNENLINWLPVGVGDIDKIHGVRIFNNFIIRKELKLAEPIDDIIRDFVVDGTMAVKLRWTTKYRHVRDKKRGRGKIKKIAHQLCAVELIPIDQVFLPYTWRGVNDSDLGQEVWQRIEDIKAASQNGLYIELSVEDLIRLEKDECVWEKDSITDKKAENEGVEPFGDAPRRLIEMYMPWYVDGDLIDSVFVVDYKTGMYFSGKALANVAPTGRKPWVIEPFIRHTHRPYGISLPELMRGLAKELDAIHNQRIDAGTVSIAPFGWYRAGSSFDPDKIAIEPGLFFPVDDIKDVQLAQFPSNFVASYQEENIIIGYIEKLTATSAYQMGRESDVVKSRATATGTMALISQGEQAHTILGMRCQRAISKILTKIFEMYQCFMPPNFAERIVDDAGELLFPDGLTPEEIDGGYDAYMTLDATAGNKAMERQVNGAMLDNAERLISLAQDPRGYKIAEDFLISIGKPEVESYLGPRPKAKGPTAGLLPMGPGMQGMGGPQGGPGA